MYAFTVGGGGGGGGYIRLLNVGQGYVGGGDLRELKETGVSV